MKNFRYGVLFLAIVGIGLFSCQKAEVNKTENQSPIELTAKRGPFVPPLRHFECGEPVVGSIYPCPNARCFYLGYDCLPTVYIYAEKRGFYISNYEEYLEATDLLDYFINTKNTSAFFENHVDEYLLLIGRASCWVILFF